MNYDQSSCHLSRIIRRFMGAKPAVTSGQIKIFPMLQLLLTRTNQKNKEPYSHGCGKVLFIQPQTWLYVCGGGGG
jgi:hypothetical protein